MKLRAHIVGVLLACLAVAGCHMESKEPYVARVDQEKLVLSELPDILLVRRVVLEETATEFSRYGKTWTVDGVDSDLGEAGEVAGLDCVIDGLKSVLPRSEIVPAERFWKAVVRDGEKVRLPALFEPPLATRWHDLDVEFLVAAYHHEIRAREFNTFLLMSFYSSVSRQRAGGITVDVPNQTTLNAARASADEEGYFGHVLIYPLGGAESAASEPCEVIGELSAATIVQERASSAPRVLVLAAASDPYAAAQAVSRKQAQDKPGQDEQAQDDQKLDEMVQ